MRTAFSPKNNPRVIIIQKLYGKFFNNEEKLDFPKHRFKRFIKDIHDWYNTHRIGQLYMEGRLYMISIYISISLVES